MRHQVVKRVTVLLAILVLLSAGAFAWLVRDQPETSPPPAQDAPAGASLFERHCTPCHSAGGLRQTFRDSGATRAAWERLLGRHGKATDEEDRLILDYLRLQRPPGGT